jgi:hypothetical protein
VRRGLGRRRALRWLQRCRPEARASALLASSPARYAALAAALAFRRTCSMRVHRYMGRWRALRWLRRGQRRPHGCDIASAPSQR